ncbi:MAG: hypothetical protein N4A61_14395 [Pelagimonas sp.]|jgi:hypothetical protein|nr:hypothetical protein [Pelagimonas sp.]
MSDDRFLWVKMVIWNGLGGLSAVVGLVGLLVAGAFGIVEYRDRKATARASETLNMIEIWELRGAQQAYHSISTALEPLVVAQAPRIATHPDRARTIKRNIARRALQDAEAGAYDVVVQFFTRLSLCVRTDICSADVAKVFFGDTLVDFRDWFDDEIEKRRKIDRRHANELDWLICAMSDGVAPPGLQVTTPLCQGSGQG